MKIFTLKALAWYDAIVGWGAVSVGTFSFLGLGIWLCVNGAWVLGAGSLVSTGLSLWYGIYLINRTSDHNNKIFSYIHPGVKSYEEKMTDMKMVILPENGKEFPAIKVYGLWFLPEYESGIDIKRLREEVEKRRTKVKNKKWIRTVQEVPPILPPVVDVLSEEIQRLEADLHKLDTKEKGLKKELEKGGW